LDTSVTLLGKEGTFLRDFGPAPLEEMHKDTTCQFRSTVRSRDNRDQTVALVVIGDITVDVVAISFPLWPFTWLLTVGGKTIGTRCQTL
jgi:hypothetical protein